MSCGMGMKLTPLIEATDTDESAYFWDMDTPEGRSVVCFYRWSLVQSQFFKGGWMWESPYPFDLVLEYKEHLKSLR
jgi:hypothetical protein